MNERICALGSCLLLLASCASHTEWRSEDGLAARKIEVQVDRDGRPLELEYHMAPSAVPASIHQAMDRLHPGGLAVDAEKEYVGSELFWELTKEIDGREIEAMFHADGTLHSEEIEVDGSDVPANVREAVSQRMPGQVTKYEEIRDGERRLVEYHVKVQSNDMNWKIRVSTGGKVVGIVREVPAEIEVPAD